MERRGKLTLVIALLGVLVVPVAVAQDNIEGPWGTIHGNLYGQSRADYGCNAFHDNNATQAWAFDTLANGLSRTGGRSEITFDAEGNLYFITTSGNRKLASLTPGGQLRWIAKEGGVDYQIDSGFNETSAVVGVQRVYVLGARGVAAAFNKATGALLWKVTLPGGATWSDYAQCTPILYNGKLYMIGIDKGIGTVYISQVSETGSVDWTSTLSITGQAGPQAAFVPSIFASGAHHGIYLVTNGTVEADSYVYGYEINPTVGTGGATQVWASAAGHLAYSHVIYNPLAPNSGGLGRLYVATWSDYPAGDVATIWAYNPVTGAMFNNHGASAGGGHGFYDAVMLDWDNQTIIAGNPGFRLYKDNGDDTFSLTKLAYNPWFGEPRVLGQLISNAAGDSIVIDGTNSQSNLGANHEARLIVANLTEADPGPFLDGPTYIDDVEVWDGEIGSGTLVFSDNFNGYTVNQPLAGNGGWQHDNAAPSGDDVTNPVMVVTDPTNSSNKVIKLKAASTDSGWVGAFNNAVTTTAFGVATVRWRQWRNDYTDNLWYDFDANASFADVWGLGWDQDGKQGPWHFDQMGASDTGSVLQTPGIWQTVTLRFDFGSLQATIDIDGTTGTPVDASSVNSMLTGVDFEVEGTATSNQFNIAGVEYNTGIVNDNAFTLHGGPVMGPDGKIYYAHRTNAKIVAISSAQLDGDMNCDGVVNNQDIDGFIEVLFGKPYPYCCAHNGDTNHDGVVNNQDIDGFIAALFGL